jgi:arylsulfatase A-like enzyme
MTNIALVVLDTLRKDAFDRHFDWLPGRRFERAYSTANWTVPAHASLFTGKYASEVGVHADHMQFDCDESALAERLCDAGYTTHAFSANAHVTEHFAYDRGFTDFRSPYEKPDDRLFNWREFARTTDATGIEKYLRGGYACIAEDCATLPSLIAGLKMKRASGSEVEYGGTIEAKEEIRDMQFDDREFLFLNLMETHEPYVAPPEYMTDEEPDLTNAVGDIVIGEIDGEHVRQAYDDCARYLADIYDDLFDTLDEEFDYIVTVSDHGELLGEHDAWAHEHGVFPELTHVPLCISGEGLDGTCTKTVNVQNVHDTILDMAGVGEGTDRSLLGAVDGRECVTEYLGLTDWSEGKLEANGYGESVERYNETLRGYATLGDYYGYETVEGFDGVGTESDDEPREELARLVDDLDIREVAQDSEVPDEIKDQLEHLGYA